MEEEEEVGEVCVGAGGGRAADKVDGLREGE